MSVERVPPKRREGLLFEKSATGKRGCDVPLWDGPNPEALGSGYLRDEYTSLGETRDRILATSLSATWRYRDGEIAFAPAWWGVRNTLLETFAAHQSESVQHTMYAMGRAVMDGCGEVVRIHLVMPNRHHLPVDLTPFGLENRNEIFVATEEPHGLIEATLERD